MARMSIDVVIEAPEWEDLALEALAERAERATLAHLSLDADAFETVVLGCDDTRIATLNADFRGKPQPTNVLSWPSEDRAPQTPGAAPRAPQPGELGDIAIACGVCVAEAVAANKPVPDHVTHLIVHGILHLLGYDHMTELDAALMERMEVEILATLGLPDPY